MKVVGSMIIGYLVGLVGSLITKLSNKLGKDPTIETIIILLTGYFSFNLVEAYFAWSGVISCAITGIVLNHYAFYNISTRGKIVSKYVTNLLSTIAENILFIMFGLTFFNNKSEAVDWSLIC